MHTLVIQHRTAGDAEAHLHEGNSKPALAPPEATIGKEKATAFFKAYKVAGHTPEESKIFLKETWGIEAPRNSADIPVSGEAKAFEWANTPAPIRVKAEGLFETLGFTPEERVAFVNQHKIDWAKVAEELEAELTRRNAAEQ